MGTILSIDAPTELRRLDTKFTRPIWRGWLIIRLFFAAAAILVFVAATVSGSLFGMVLTAAVFVLLAGPIWWLSWRLRAARSYRMPVLAGAEYILKAHVIYWRLTPPTREYAGSLIRTMYRLASIETRSHQGYEDLKGKIATRYAALQRLQAAEDQVVLAAAKATLNDADDLAAAAAWEESLAEVESLVIRDS